MWKPKILTQMAVIAKIYKALSSQQATHQKASLWNNFGMWYTFYEWEEQKKHRDIVWR